MKKEQFERAKRSPDHGVLVHLVCNEADVLFYSENRICFPIPNAPSVTS